jgi:signal transduction histidine kinase
VRLTTLRLTALALAMGAIALTARTLTAQSIRTVAGDSSLRWAAAVIAAVGLAAAGAAAQHAIEGALVALLGALWLAPELEGSQGAPGWLVSSASAVPALLLGLVLLVMLCRTGGGRVVLLVGVAAAVAAATARLFLVNPFTGLWCWRSCAPNPWAVTDAGRRLESGLAAVAVAAGLMVAARRIVAARDRAVDVAVVALLLGIGSPVALQTVASTGPSSMLALTGLVGSLSGAVLLSGALAWPRLHTRLATARLNRLAGRLTDSPAPDELARALGRAAGDSALRVEYWDPQRDRYVEADGRPVISRPVTAGARYTSVTRNGALVARIEHAARLDSMHLDRALGAALRLVLENGQLRAAALAELDEARRTRARFVERATAERRLLERNLHDGAQQRVVAMSLLGWMLADQAVGASAEPAATQALTLTSELLDELRRVARGIYPAVVADAGLAGALEDLADSSFEVVVDVRCESLGELDESVATTAYLVCAAALDDARQGDATHMDVSAAHADGLLVVTIEDDARTERGGSAARLVDQVAALSGSLASSADDTSPRLLLEIPCVS